MKQELGDPTAARAAGLEAQRLSEIAHEPLFVGCQRWAQMARAAPHDDVDGADDDQAEAFYWAAIRGYRERDHRAAFDQCHESGCVLLELASFLIKHDHAERFAALEPELARVFASTPSELRRLVQDAKARGFPADVLRHASEA